MNALQFIKWHGIDDARYIIKEKIYCHDHEFTMEALQDLVESVDLITKVGGIKKAKEMLALFEDRKGRSDNYMPLFRAAQDYESIYGEGNEAN
jgi:hypothetical protein